MKEEPSLAAILYEPTSWPCFGNLTTEPGIQVYTGNFLERPALRAKEAKLRTPFRSVPGDAALSGFAKPSGFSDHILAPGKEFHSTTIYKFSTK